MPMDALWSRQRRKIYVEEEDNLTNSGTENSVCKEMNWNTLATYKHKNKTGIKDLNTRPKL